MASFKGKKCELTQKLFGMDNIFSNNCDISISSKEYYVQYKDLLFACCYLMFETLLF